MGILDRAVVPRQSSKYTIHGATVMKKIRALFTVWNIKRCQQKWDILVAPHQLSLGGLLCVAHVNSAANVRCPASNTPKNMAITEQFSSL